jgi:hypothetical protein
VFLDHANSVAFWRCMPFTHSPWEKRAHGAERSRRTTPANAARTPAGYGASGFTDPALNDLPALHLTKLRDTLTPIRAALGLSPITYTDTPLTTGTP